MDKKFGHAIVKAENIGHITCMPGQGWNREPHVRKSKVLSISFTTAACSTYYKGKGTWTTNLLHTVFHSFLSGQWHSNPTGRGLQTDPSAHEWGVGCSGSHTVTSSPHSSPFHPSVQLHLDGKINERSVYQITNENSCIKVEIYWKLQMQICTVLYITVMLEAWKWRLCKTLVT